MEKNKIEEFEEVLDNNENMETDVKSDNNNKLTKYINYNMAGVLHFLQTEWYRFDSEKITWEKEKSEMMAKISFQEGELLQQKQLNHYLLRRIKMLELKLSNDSDKISNLRNSNPESNLPDYKNSNSTDSIKITNGQNESNVKTPDLNLSSKNYHSRIPNYRSLDEWTKNHVLLKQYFNELEAVENLINKRRETSSIPLIKSFNLSVNDSTSKSEKNTDRLKTELIQKHPPLIDTNEKVKCQPKNEIIKGFYNLNTTNSQLLNPNKNNNNNNNNNNYNFVVEKTMSTCKNSSFLSKINEIASLENTETLKPIENGEAINKDLEFLDDFLEKDLEM